MSASAPARPELSGDLWRHAQGIAGGRGFQFSNVCAVNMQAFIDVGVATLVRDDALLDSTKVSEAKDAIAKLVGKMIELAIEDQRGQTSSATESTSARILHEFTLSNARSWFCPCYPFC
jgi:hypothetical protein